jgi:polyphosphate kinase
MTIGSVGKELQTHKASRIEWLDRDLSLLAFNARVLDWAKRADVPLLERLRYLCIVSSNLDEFFEVRAGCGGYTCAAFAEQSGARLGG